MPYTLDRPLHESSPSYSTLSPSSVPSIRGSLDPSPKSKKADRQGWRYLQCTDIKDELRVLLPPRPSAIYANLLKVEAHLLAKNDPESLQEAALIAILKNAMVERCEKLAAEANLASPQARTRIVEAPGDFKLRRLERWWEGMEASGRTKQSSNRAKTQENGIYAAIKKIRSPTKEDYTPPPSANSYTKRPSLNTQSAIRPPYPGETPSSSSISRRKHSSRPAPLSVAHSRHNSDQISPTVAVAHTQRAPDQIAYQASQDHSLHNSQLAHGQPARPTLRHSVAYASSFTDNHASSPLEAPFNPFVTNNPSTLSTSHHMVSSADMNGFIVNNQTPVYATRTPNTSTIKSPVADPSYLKDRFHATYMTASSESNSSSSLNANKQLPPVAQPFAYAASDPNRRASHELLSTTNGQATHSRDPRAHRSSFSMPVPGVSASASYQEHRRRATLDCDDTDRSVRRTEYMYQGTAANKYPNGAGAYGEQVARKQQRIYQSPIANDSPQSSGSQTSHYAHDGTHLRSSPSRGHQPQRTSPQHYSKDSPSLLPPAPALSNSRRGSYGSDVSANGKTRSPRGPEPVAQPRPALRKTHSRRGLRDEAGVAHPNGQQVRSPTHYEALQQTFSDTHIRGRTRRGERSPRRRSSHEPSPRREDAVIPDMSILSPISSNRNSLYSRYTSGDSSISEPVIPDVSLIREAEAARGKGGRIRRRLVPTRSSSESGADHLGACDFASEVSSVVGDVDDYVHVGINEALNANGAYYKRPYRTRDGYGSGYNSEAEGGQRSRAPSRTPSRPPSRGILKRSSSVCSARSTKSVRIEIPRDRRALEEVRDAEDKVDTAQKQKDDLQRQKDKGVNVDSELRKATKMLDDAKNSLQDKEENYHAILALMKERSIAAEAPKYV